MKKSLLLFVQLPISVMTSAVGIFQGDSVQKSEETFLVQKEIPVQKYSVYTNGFWNNWFLSVGGSYVSDMGRHGDGNWGNLLFDGHYGRYGLNLAIGKWFTPGVGLRLKLAGLINDKPTWYSHSDVSGFWSARADIMFNMSNLLCGYNPNRIWNMTLLGGGGWIDKKSSLDFGLQSSWKVAPKVELFAEAALFLADKHGKLLEFADCNEKYWDVSIGLTFNLGKDGFKGAVDSDVLMALNAEQLDALSVALNEQQTENARLRNELAKSPTVVTKSEVINKPIANYRIFFNIGSACLVAEKEIVNLEVIANLAKENGATIYVTGYADNATGSALYNQKLSEKRANVVAKELERLGISSDKMVVEGKGGVATLNPVSYNRCVVVEFK